MATCKNNGRHDEHWIRMLHPYLPKELGSLETQLALVKYNALDRAALLELALAEASNGNLVSSDKDGMDYTDKSDSKGVTIRTVIKSTKYGRKTYHYERKVAQITNVSTKKGALRVVAYDAVNRQFRFFFIHNFVANSERNRGTLAFDATGNSKYLNGECGIECVSFESLARMVA